MLNQYPVVVYDACSLQTSSLDTYDGDYNASQYFTWGYYDAQYNDNLPGHDADLTNNPWYIMGFEDRKYEISLGIPYDLEFLPFYPEEF